MNKTIACANAVHPVSLEDKTKIELKNIALKYPDIEVCGFLLHSGAIVKIVNVAYDPEHAFVMDPKMQLEAMTFYHYGIKGVWHTHVNGSQWPSVTDGQGVINGLSSNWLYWIVTKEDVYEYSWEILEDG